MNNYCQPFADEALRRVFKFPLPLTDDLLQNNGDPTIYLAAEQLLRMIQTPDLQREVMSFRKSGVAEVSSDWTVEEIVETTVACVEAVASQHEYILLHRSPLDILDHFVARLRDLTRENHDHPCMRTGLCVDKGPGCLCSSSQAYRINDFAMIYAYLESCTPCASDAPTGDYNYLAYGILLKPNGKRPRRPTLRTRQDVPSLPRQPQLPLHIVHPLVTCHEPLPICCGRRRLSGRNRLGAASRRLSSGATATYTSLLERVEGKDEGGKARLGKDRRLQRRYDLPRRRREPTTARTKCRDRQSYYWQWTTNATLQY